MQETPAAELPKVQTHSFRESQTPPEYPRSTLRPRPAAGRPQSQWPRDAGLWPWAQPPFNSVPQMRRAAELRPGSGGVLKSKTASSASRGQRCVCTVHRSPCESLRAVGGACLHDRQRRRTARVLFLAPELHNIFRRAEHGTSSSIRKRPALFDGLGATCGRSVELIGRGRLSARQDELGHFGEFPAWRQSHSRLAPESHRSEAQKRLPDASLAGLCRGGAGAKQRVSPSNAPGQTLSKPFPRFQSQNSISRHSASKAHAMHHPLDAASPSLKKCPNCQKLTANRTRHSIGNRFSKS